MTTTSVNSKLGASFRLYVAKTDAVTAGKDLPAEWARATNENDITYSATSKTTDHEMKENGGEIVVLPGALKYDLSANGAEIYDDLAADALQSHLGKTIHVQVRYVDTAGIETVKIEGLFSVTEFSRTYPSSGAATFSVKLAGSGNVSFNAVGRALITS